MADPLRLNNKAIALLSSGMFEQAIAALTQGLKIITLTMSERALDNGFSITDDKNSISDVGSSSRNTADAGAAVLLDLCMPCPSRLCFGFISSTPFSCHTSWRLSVQRDTFVYEDPIYLSGPFPRLTDPGCCETLSFIVLYNLGLTHHLAALSKKNLTNDGLKQRNWYLRKAMVLYEHANHILLNEHIECSPLHVMAIANNLGHIHFALGDETRAKTCFNYLLSSILCLVECGGNGARLRKEVLDGFLTNVIPLIAGSSSAPAA